MTNVSVEVYRTGDAVVQVDTDAWIADRMTRDDDRTESLHNWLAWRDGDPVIHSYRDHYPTTDSVLRWAHFAFRGEVTGLYGEGEAFSVATFNHGDHILDDELGALIFGTDDGTFMVETSRGAYGAYVMPTVYRLTSDMDSVISEITRCLAFCQACDSQFDCDGGVELTCFDGGGSYRVGDLAWRDDDSDAEGFIRCPSCAEQGRRVALHFDAPTAQY